MTEENILVDTLAENQQRLEFDEAQAREALERILTQPLLPVERDQIVRQARNFAASWIVTRVASRYDFVSKEIWGLKREMVYGNSSLTVPTLFRAKMGENLEKGVAEIDASGKDIYGHAKQFKVRAEVPTITDEAREAYIKAVRYSAQITSRAFRDPLVGRIMSTQKIPLPVNSTYSLVWAPDKLVVEDVTPVPIDPAIIMTYEDLNFVVYKWDIDNERPISPLLKNFQESFKWGSIQKPE